MKSTAAKKLYNQAYKKLHRERLLIVEKARRIYIRNRVLSHYSNGSFACACCGESIYEFLSLDHINGGGNQHRKSLGSKYIDSWLVKNNFPAGYQVLCHNCNMAKAFYKGCPHKMLIKKQFETEGTHVQ